MCSCFAHYHLQSGLHQFDTTNLTVLHMNACLRQIFLVRHILVAETVLLLLAYYSGVIRTTFTFLQNIVWRKMRLKFWNFLPSLQCVPITLDQRVQMQYCQKLIRFHHIRLYLDLNLCNEDLLAKICKNVKILCTTPPMATTGTVTHTTLTFLQTCKNVKVVCVTPFIGSKNVKVWHYINFARMLRFVHITLT